MGYRLQLTSASSIQPHQKTPLQKTSHDFQLSLVAFQRAQQVSAERQRAVVEVVKSAVEEEESRFAEMVFRGAVEGFSSLANQ